MSERLLLQGGTVICPATGFHGKTDLAIADGTIVAMGHIPAHFNADEIIPAESLLIVPGLVDLASVPEPTAAAHGGVTTLCCPPDVNPVIDNAAAAEYIQHGSNALHCCRVLPIGALTCELGAEKLSEMAALRAAGCVAVGNTNHPFNNTRLLRHAFDYAATFNLPVFFEATDPSLTSDGAIHEGKTATALGMKSCPDAAETIAVTTALALQRETAVQLHFTKISSHYSLPFIASAKAQGHRVTADVAIHHLWLTDEDIHDFDANYHTYPPLRSKASRDALRLALKDGTLDAICSDHRPHAAKAKTSPFAESAPGISGIETLLPLALQLTQDTDLGLDEIIGFLTYKPAAIIHQPIGRITVGESADLCLIDMNHTAEVSPHDFKSFGKNTPFLGWKLSSKIIMTIFAGRIVFRL